MAVAISVTPNTKSLNVGQHQKIAATVTGGAAGQTWASNLTGIATVDSNGLVTAVAPGIATITATSTADGTKTAVSVITVPGSHAIHLADRHNNYIQSMLQERLETLNPLGTEAALIKQLLIDMRTFGND